MRKAIKPCGVCLCASVFLCIMVVGGYGRPPKPPPPKHRVHKKQRFVPAPPDLQPAPPHPNYIWIPRYRHPAGVHIGGFWRPPYKKGFVWVEGYWNENGEWVF